MARYRGPEILTVEGAFQKVLVDPLRYLAALVSEGLPERVRLPWGPSGRSSRGDQDEVELRVRPTARSARHDVSAVLRLIDAGELRVSDKTRRPGQAAVKVVAAALEGGDWYTEEDRADYDYDPGWDLTIKPFAWPMLVQAAKLAELAGTRLQLTAAGRKATARPAHEVLRAIWNGWQKTTLVDEFNRVVEEGLSVRELEEFLLARSIEDLPQTVTTFLADAQARAGQVRDLGAARLLECADAAVAQLLARDRRLRGLCEVAGERRLVFRAADEAAVRKALKELGVRVAAGLKLEEDGIMAISHTNRKGEVYYLHQGVTKTGKARYHFSKKEEGGDLAEAIPEGYEAYEKPDGQVYLRKRVPTAIRPEEVEVVKAGLRAAGVNYFLVEAEKDSIVVHTPSTSDDEVSQLAEELGGGLFGGLRAKVAEHFQQKGSYSAMLRFVLVGGEGQRFRTDRWCFRGAINGWIPLNAGWGELPELVVRYAPHLGEESFFDLM